MKLPLRGPALAGLVLTCLTVLVAAAAPLVAPHDPIEISDPVGARLLAPSTTHLLGTDAFGRDVLSRLLFAARGSLAVALAAALLGSLLGAAVGLAAALGSPRLDAVLMRAVDAALALPRVFLLLAAFALFETMSRPAIVLLLGGTGWFATSRLIRAHARQLRDSDFITATLALGGGRLTILRHLAPHVAATLVVCTTLDVGSVVLLESGLGFLGLGVQPPDPTWGGMILEGRNVLVTAPWVALAPGAALTIAVVAFNLLGDGLRDALNPRRTI